MLRTRNLLSVAVLAALACGAAVARSPKPEVAGTGETMHCLKLSRVLKTQVLDDQTILFYTKGRKVYRNALAQRCPSLGFHQSFSYKANSSSLCDSDLIEVLEGQPGVAGATCGLSDFERVDVRDRKRSAG